MPGCHKTGEHSALLTMFATNPCAVVHLGYLSGHLQRWRSGGTALGEVVYSLSLAPGESRNIAVIDLRRRQQAQRNEQTNVNETLVSNQEHSFALQEVATAVALEQQFGKTAVEAGSLVSGGSFVAAGALVGGLGGALIGTVIAPGIGTAIGAGIGAAAGVAAGGLVWAGAEALGKIESETAGNRDILATTNQRISQSTSQQSALVRSLWSTVVTEDVQEETLGVQTSNVTNYNHMHALNMEYYELLHRYNTATTTETITPILYLPYAPLSFDDRNLVAEFWHLIRLALPADLREKGDHVFVDPPPATFIPEPVPVPPASPTDLIIEGGMELELEVDWNQVSFNGAQVHVAVVVAEGDGTRSIDAAIEDPTHDRRRDRSTYRGVVSDALTVADIESARVQVHTSSGRDDEVNVRLSVLEAATSPADGLDLSGYQIGAASLDIIVVTNVRKVRERKFPWFPANTAATQHRLKVREAARVKARNEAKRKIHTTRRDRLDQWESLVLAAVCNEPYRMTRTILSTMESGRLSWLLERMLIATEGSGTPVPLHEIASTIPIGISDDSILLKMNSNVPSSASSKVREWPPKLAERSKDLKETATFDQVFLPGAGVFAEGVLGRSNAAEYVDSERYWNWQDSPIPHQAAEIQAISTAPRNSAPLGTDPTVPDSQLPLVSAPAFPAPTAINGVLAALQNGNLFRDLSGQDQLTSVLNGLTEVAGETARTAATLTGDAASDALASATEIGNTVAGLTESLISSPQASTAGAPSNPTEAANAIDAIKKGRAQGPAQGDTASDAVGLPRPGTGGGGGGGDNGAGGSGTAPPSPVASLPDFIPDDLPTGPFAPGAISQAPASLSPTFDRRGQELRSVVLDAAANGVAPDDAAVKTALDNLYTDAVLPLMLAARRNPALLNSAGLQYLKWVADSQLIGSDELRAEIEAERGDGLTILGVGLEVAIRGALSDLEAFNDLEFLRDVGKWVTDAQLLGIDDRSPFFTLQGAVDQSALRVKAVTGFALVSTNDGSGGEADIFVQGGLAIGQNEPLDEHVATVTVDATNAQVSPPSGPMAPGADFDARATRIATGPMVLKVTSTVTLVPGVDVTTTVDLAID